MSAKLASNPLFILIRLLYLFITSLLFPIVLFKLFWQFKGSNKFVSRIYTGLFGGLREVDGIEAYRNSQKRIWIHAVSVGETHAAIPLMRELILRNNLCNIILTNTTLSGFNFFKSIDVKDGIFKERVVHCFSPVDFVWAVKFFLNTINPHIAIFIETEIWPNLIQELSNRKIKIVLANGRLSERSLTKFKIFSWFSRPIINKFSLILAQSKSDAIRFEEAGAKGKILVTGNLKFDAFVSDKLVKLGLRWRKSLPKKSVWLALSTRKNEEKKIFQAWAKFKPTESLLIVVPRHPERFDWVVDQAKKQGFIVMRRSNFLNNKLYVDNFSNIDVVVGDSIGEVAAYASFADLSLVGGSVIDCGGQSPIELSFQECPVFFGPHMSNFANISQQLRSSGAGFEINSYEEWLIKGQNLLLNNRKMNTSKEATNKFVLKNKGASEFSVKQIEKLA